MVADIIAGTMYYQVAHSREEPMGIPDEQNWVAGTAGHNLAFVFEGAVSRRSR